MTRDRMGRQRAAAEWKTASLSVSLEIADQVSFEAYTGLVSDDYPGLAVSPRLTVKYDGQPPQVIEGSFAVTHVESGFALTPSEQHLTREQAQAVVHNIARIANWTKSREYHERDKDRLREKVNGAVHAATVTCDG